MIWHGFTLLEISLLLFKLSKMNVLWLLFSSRINGKPWRMVKFKGDLKMSWNDWLINMLGRWSWRNLKMKMNAKAKVLSVGSQFQWRNSRINDEAFHEVFQAQHISKVRMEAHMKNTISLWTLKRIQYFYLRERKILT